MKTIRITFVSTLLIILFGAFKTLSFEDAGCGTTYAQCLQTSPRCWDLIGDASEGCCSKTFDPDCDYPSTCTLNSYCW
jgi:hypothetical protein